MVNQFLEVGKIVTTQGLKGEVRVEPWCDSVEFLCGFEKLYFDKGKTEMIVENARPYKTLGILKFKGIDIIEDAQKLRGRILYIDRKDINLEDGNYFVQDLLGAQVIDAETGKVYGKLCEVSQTGANDVYHIKNDDKIYLIPAIPQVISRVDVPGEKIYITPLEGLFEDED